MSVQPNERLRDETIFPLEASYREAMEGRLASVIETIKSERDARTSIRWILQSAYTIGFEHGYTIGVSRNGGEST